MWARSSVWIEHLPPKSLSFYKNKKEKARSKQGVVGSKAPFSFEKEKRARKRKLS